MFAMQFAMLLALSALASGARAECSACVAGRCHSRKPILSGYPVTNRMAIDQVNNVLYLQLNGQITAIFLDGLEHRLVNMISTSAMTFQHKSHTLYLITKERAIYKHYLASNTTIYVSQINNNIVRPNIMEHLGDNLVYVEVYPNDTNAFHFIQTNVGNWHLTYLINYLVSDFIIDSSHIFFVSNDTLYVCDNQVYTGTSPPRPPTAILSKKNIKIFSNDEYLNRFDEWIYIGAPTEKLIYKLNKITQELVIHAGYESGALEDFVLGKNGVIVFLDADGSIAQWEPTSEDQRCVVEPPHDNHFIRQTTCF